MAELPYRIVIGLETHVQLLTRTKLFCGCSTQFGLPPNSATCPVCIGLPGALPVLNRRAFELALRAALALHCEIPDETRWDRKNYFYPDLPKGYQISQYDQPLGGEGWLEIETEDGKKKIGIIRAHLEEDAGKMLHDEQGTGQASLVDLNRAGTPLLEIVSKPELSSPEEARLYLEEMRLLMREMGVSDCEMQEGSLRCDANINLHVPLPEGGFAATPIVEIKNLNSFRALERATRYEAEQQYERFQSDANYRFGQVPKSTAGWIEEQGVTVPLRQKEEESDYRYFPDPDLVPITVDAMLLERIRAEMGESPAAMRQRLVEEYGLSDYDVGVLTTRGRALVAYFEEVARSCGDAKAACNWVTNQVLATLKEKQIADIEGFTIPAHELGVLITKQKSMGMNKKVSGEVYTCMLEHGVSAEEAMNRCNVQPPADASQLVEMVRSAIDANPKAVADYKKGKAAALNAIKGAVMRQAKGIARPDVVQQMILEQIENA